MPLKISWKATTAIMAKEPFPLEQRIERLESDASEISTEPSHKIALNHAWNHFSYHANQRLLTLRFYLIIVAILFGSYYKLISDGEIGIAASVAVLAAVISYVFLRLDLRNKDLIKTSADALKIEEEYLAKKLDYNEIKIIENIEKNRRPLYPRNYGQSLKFIFNLMICLFVLLSVLAVFSLCWPCISAKLLGANLLFSKNCI